MDKAAIIDKIVVPLIIVLIGIIVYLIIKSILNKAFRIRAKKLKDNKYNTIESLIKGIIKYFIMLVCALMILEKYGIDTKSIITSLGIVGAAVALAMQDFLKDFVAGITIVIENQFAIGDIVKIGDFMGTVTTFTLKTTRIKAWTGEEKIINNHLISEVINYTHNNSIAIVDVGLPYEEDVEKLEKVLNKICIKISKQIPNLKKDVALLGLENLDSSAMVYRIIAEVKSGEQFNTQRQLRKLIKQELDKEGISIPYSQLVIHNG
ncbi:MAG: mechanosensitive ion channel [Bacilli bacterium]|nr:mechanosensitive ion channel [Bacilli bacterium]